MKLTKISPFNLHLKNLYALPFVFICIFLICARKYVWNYFNTMTGAEFLFFIHTPIDGADKRLVHIFFNKCVLNPLIYAVLICYAREVFFLLTQIWNKKSQIFKFIFQVIQYMRRYYTFWIIIISLLGSGYLLTKFKFIKDIIEMQKAPYSTFFEENFVRPSVQNISLSQKKNLIIIAVESLEKTFENKNFFGQSMLPHLEKLETEGVQFNNYTNGWNTTNTMSFVMALFAGVPKSCNYAHLINHHGNKVNLLNNYYSLGNFLNEQGYQTYAIQTSDAKYAGQGHFFETHGIQNIIDKYYIKNQFNIKAKEDEWGYNDDILFDTAKKVLMQRENSAPYFMFIQTIDSHVNYLPNVKDHKKFKNKYHNIIYNTNLQIYNFVLWLKTQPDYKNTVIVILGDHLRMGNNFPMPKKRQNYNLFLNVPVPQNTDRTFSQVDLLPTVLEALGAKVENHQLGIGISVFSDRETLLEKYGNSLGSLLAKRSKLNEELWKL